MIPTLQAELAEIHAKYPWFLSKLRKHMRDGAITGRDYSDRADGMLVGCVYGWLSAYDEEGNWMEVMDEQQAAYMARGKASLEICIRDVQPGDTPDTHQVLAYLDCEIVRLLESEQAGE